MEYVQLKSSKSAILDEVENFPKRNMWPKLIHEKVAYQNKQKGKEETEYVCFIKEKPISRKYLSPENCCVHSTA